MMMNSVPANPDLLRLVAGIVAAHVAHNTLAAEVIPDLIRSVHAALSAVAGSASAAAATAPEFSKPAAPVNRSVFPDHIVCLEDGQKMTMLKRHLRAFHGMTPQEYRTRWGLPPTYPMVAPNYAERRSTLARTMGLGHTPVTRKTPRETQPDTVSEPPVRVVPEGVRGAPRGRKAKAI